MFYSALYGYTGPGITWANETNFVMNNASGTGITKTRIHSSYQERKRTAKTKKIKYTGIYVTPDPFLLNYIRIKVAVYLHQEWQLCDTMPVICISHYSPPCPATFMRLSEIEKSSEQTFRVFHHSFVHRSHFL